MEFEEWLRAELAGGRPPLAPLGSGRRGRRWLTSRLVKPLQLALVVVTIALVGLGASLPARLDAIQLGAMAPAPALPVTTWAGVPPTRSGSGESESHADQASVTSAPAVSGAPAHETGDDRRPASGNGSTPGGSQPPPSSGSPSSPPSQSGSMTRTFTLTGGSVTIRCSGGAPGVISMAPNPGFDAETESEDGGAVLQVRFRSDTHESRLEASCNAGTVTGQIEESAS